MAVHDFVRLDDTICLLVEPTGIAAYDFDFRAYFPCRSVDPQQPRGAIDVVARIGAIPDYAHFFLVNSSEQHQRATRLSHWYPLIADLTPRSKWYAQTPSVPEVEFDFQWPIFIKGARQTSHHQRALSIINGPQEFQAALRAYQQDRILRWQPLVCREFVPLRPVEDPLPDRIPSSFEFRTFWWKGNCVGSGCYWWEGKPYDWTDAERKAGLAVAQEAATRLDVPFLVIDIAQTIDGRWIVIECNDGQESGYAGASPLGIWQNIITIERSGN
jgi:hypothetical protein